MKLAGWTFLAAWGLVTAFAAAPASPAGAPGYILTNTYPDTGGRAPVAHGGKVLPPGSPGSGVLGTTAGQLALATTPGTDHLIQLSMLV